MRSGAALNQALAILVPSAAAVRNAAPQPRSPLERAFVQAHGLNSSDLREIALIKRFIDFWLADGELRAQVVGQTNADLAETYALPVPVSALRCILDPHEAQLDAFTPLPVRRFAAYLRQRADHRVHLKAACEPENPRFAAWRRRQMLRCQGQLPATYNAAIPHLPVAFELSLGCSVGCWFCGLSAAALGSVFHATPENRQLWRQVLSVVHGLTGPAGGQGICFWATDPLDNPDYEAFCLDFHDILGRFPATTTALAPRQLVRTRELLTLSFAHGAEFNRFSILTLRQLHQIHNAFPPEDLLYVDIIPQNREALPSKAMTGRVLNIDDAARRTRVTSDPATIACVSGFLINLVQRSVKLISPCPASDEWPDGYRIYAHERFADVADLDQICRRMIDAHMRNIVRHFDWVRLRPDVVVSSSNSQCVTARLPRLFRTPDADRALFDLLETGLTASDAAVRMDRSLNVPPPEAFFALNTLFDRGLLEVEAEGKRS
jgi:radical SAM family RiPP maturation amino acid epimerase